MITQTPNKTQNWQTVLKQAYRDPLALLQDLNLNSSEVHYHPSAQTDFGFIVPKGFVARMQAGNPQDPLLLQVLPTQAELDPTPGYSQDPLDEQHHNPIPGLLHKYHGRVLLTLTGACAINCRYCFRRHFPYQDNIPGQAGWQRALDYIAADSSIHEVILSGGDPLLTNDKALAQLFDHLQTIPHLRLLRIHSRLPVVLPERITHALVAMLSNTPWPTTLVIHCNHPQEIDQTVIEALAPCRTAGIHLLNQAVLLAKINDTAEIQCQLSHRLLDAGVLPYYLHLLDPVSGAAHFDVTKERALEIYQQMRQQLPGYLLPRLVKEIAGATSKLPVTK